MERFAGSCSAICDSTSVPDDLKAVCDTGSYNYCAKDAEQNIGDLNCKTYLNRVAGNYTAQRTGLTYSNPIRFPSGSTVQISNYYNDLGIAVSKYGTKDIGRLTGQSTADLIKILHDNNESYYTEPIAQPLVGMVTTYCSSSTADPTFCSESPSSWGTEAIRSTIPALLADLNSKIASGSLVQAYSSNDYVNARILHKKFPRSFAPVEAVLLANLSKLDLNNVFLAELRSYSPNLQVGIDAFVIGIITKKSNFAQENLDSTAIYNISLENNPMMYDPAVQAFLTNITAFKTDNGITVSDPFVTLATSTDSANLQSCSTGNPLTNPICTQMSTVPGSTLATAIQNNTQSYCSEVPNDQACIDYINTNPSAFSNTDINHKMLSYCLGAGVGDPNCSPFSKINGSADWLKTNTANITNADGTITGVCGTTNGLPVETCQQVCATYPDLCVSDVQQKCAMPANRYSANVDYFEEKKTFIIGNSWIDILIMIVIISVLLSVIVERNYIWQWLRRKTSSQVVPSGLNSYQL